MSNKHTSKQLGELLHNDPMTAREQIESIVRLKLRSVMSIDSLERIDSELRFNFLGMDSLMAISFVKELEQYFNFKLPNTLPYNFPTIRAVSDYLFELIYEMNS